MQLCFNLNLIISDGMFIKDKVLKSGLSKFCGRLYPCLSRPYPFKLFKGCLPQILLAPLLNTLSHLIVTQICRTERNVRLKVLER